MIFRKLVVFFALALSVGVVSVNAQNTNQKAKKNKKQKNQKKKDKSAIFNARANPPGGMVEPFASLNKPAVHEDFSAMCLDSDGNPVVAWVEHDGNKDMLKLARVVNGKFSKAQVISTKATKNVLQPSLAREENGRIWVFWSQLESGQWRLYRRSLTGDGADVVAADSGNHVFADAKTDRKGRVWVVWQNLRMGSSRIHAGLIDGNTRKIRRFEIHGERDWEPRLAFGNGDEALIVHDSYRNGDYDLFLTRLKPNGEHSVQPIVATDHYEARGSAVATKDGKSLWVAYEQGTVRWGKDLGSEWRKIGGGLNYDRRIKLVKFDPESGKLDKISDVTQLIPNLVVDPVKPGTGAINVPKLSLDAEGNPWLFFRYCHERGAGYWRLAFSKFDGSEWQQARSLGTSSFCQDRRVEVEQSGNALIALWPSDGRKNKQQGDTGVYLAKIDTTAEIASAGSAPFEIEGIAPTPLKAPNDTPERERGDHNTWSIDGSTYTLYWGDVHRHTDFSNCRTMDDGCIVEHFRYAIDAGVLDYLATSDHTEVGKTMSAYEWWQSQKLADVFHNPESFVSLYAYEREQKWPYGHRNIVFDQRGGPVIYIKRANYENSPWATPLPAEDGVRPGEIAPWQLWDLLRTHGNRAVTIEHTAAGQMGTDWSVYEKIDHKFENIVEIYQGSREAYEGVGLPQPRVASAKVSNFGKFSAGTYQNALKQGHKLGAYASSDHRSVHISYGGVYVKKFSRTGILDGMDSRLTVAATDKIFMEFSCNGKPLGSVLESKTHPKLSWSVEGTAPIERLTLVRNEENYFVFKPNSKTMTKTWFDPSPLPGENRYYLRIEQVDGNMGWTSPIWVTVKE